MTHCEQLSNEQINALVAEKVMGWQWYRHPDPELGGWTGLRDPGTYRGCGDVLEQFQPTDEQRAKTRHIHVLNYLGNVSHDYAVLRHVRETWEREPWFFFQDALRAIQEVRGNRHGRDDDAACMYEPGDYARAALAALEQQGEPEGEEVNTHE